MCHADRLPFLSGISNQIITLVTLLGRARRHRPDHAAARHGIIICVFALIGVAALNIALERHYVHTGVAKELDVSSGGNAEV